MRTLKLTLAYAGGAYLGWQRQAGAPSIQGLVEAALTGLGPLPASIVAAGRTDAGVHALAQVASVRLVSTLEVSDLARALNAALPPDIRVLGVDEMPDDFHARYSARAKRYAYRIANQPVLSPFELGYAWHVPQPLHVAAMRQALEAIVGTHDFAAFQGTGSRVRDTMRTIYEARIEDRAGGHPRTFAPSGETGSMLAVTLRGDGFLRHMVRNIVGTLVDIGRGRWPPEAMAGILASRDRTRAGPTAPPQGLFLMEVEY